MWVRLLTTVRHLDGEWTRTHPLRGPVVPCRMEAARFIETDVG